MTEFKGKIDRCKTARELADLLEGAAFAGREMTTQERQAAALREAELKTGRE